MNEETILPTASPDQVPGESPATEVPATVDQVSDGSITGEVQETVEIVEIDYTPVIYDVGNGIMACILFGCFMIAGLMIVFKIMGGNPHDR